MDIKEIESIIESILFASGDPVSLETIAEILDIDKNTANNILKNMIDDYNFERRGIKIIQIEDTYQFATRPEYHKYVKKIAKSKHSTNISEAAMEVLVIIAYNQPVTKNNIEQIRGINSDTVINNLLLRGLIEEKGRLNAPGKPILLGTTKDFLKCFGLKSLDDLPPLGSESGSQQIQMIND